MTLRVHWDECYDTGIEVIDAQHRRIVAQCNALADCVDSLESDDRAECEAASDGRFDAALAALIVLARESFATKEAQLTTGGSRELDDLRCEREEFDFLTSEIGTTENFERIELQSFLALWWRGHLVGAANKFRSPAEQRLAASDGP